MKPMNSIVKNNDFKILTPHGWSDFYGIRKTHERDILRLDLESGYYLECSYDHPLFTPEGYKKNADEFNIGDYIAADVSELKVLNKFYKGSEELYDILHVDNKDYSFYANGIVSSNCRFISFEETLINPVWLNEEANKLQREPLFTTGKVRWYKEPEPNKIYLIGLDPSLGTGGDNAAIEVFELPEMIQVAEWCHNRTRIQGQVKNLLEILKFIYYEIAESYDQEGEPEIFWTVENNTLGEAALQVIEETGEEYFPGDFLTEPKRKGHVKSYRKGFNTTNRKKIEACAKLKSMLESGRMEVYSKAIVRELKFYVASGAGYEAKEGETDDLISATLLCLRMLQMIITWDDEVFDELSEDLGVDHEEVEPLPTIVDY